MNKQISITIPKEIYEETNKQYGELGFRSMQEYILDSHRRRLVAEKRYQEILRELKEKGEKLSKEEAEVFLEKLTENSA